MILDVIRLLFNFYEREMRANLSSSWLRCDDAAIRWTEHSTFPWNSWHSFLVTFSLLSFFLQFWLISAGTLFVIPNTDFASCLSITPFTGEGTNLIKSLCADFSPPVKARLEGWKALTSLMTDLLFSSSRGHLVVWKRRTGFSFCFLILPHLQQRPTLFLWKVPRLTLWGSRILCK